MSSSRDEKRVWSPFYCHGEILLIRVKHERGQPELALAL